jgi:hypothetical protein
MDLLPDWGTLGQLPAFWNKSGLVGEGILFDNTVKGCPKLDSKSHLYYSHTECGVLTPNPCI